MGYVLEEVFEFLTIEGDHFDRLVADPGQIFLGTWSEQDGGDEPDDLSRSTFGDLALSTGLEAEGEVMIAYSEGYTFVGLPEEMMMLTYHGLGGRLAKSLGARVFHIMSYSDNTPCAFITYNAEGDPVRAYNGHEQSECVEHTELGEPMEIEGTISELWSPDAILKVLVHWGAPAWLEEPDLEYAFEKARWFNAAVDREAEMAEPVRLAIEKTIFDRQFDAPPDPRRMALEQAEMQKFREAERARREASGSGLLGGLKKLFLGR